MTIRNVTILKLGTLIREVANTGTVNYLFDKVIYVFKEQSHGVFTAAGRYIFTIPIDLY